MSEYDASGMSVLQNTLSGEGFRTITLSGPALPQLAGAPGLSFVSLDGEDALNTLFNFTLKLKSPESEYANRAYDNIDLSAALEKSLTVGIALDSGESNLLGDAGQRFINALVVKARQTASHPLRYFEFEMRPWLYLATLNSDWRCFQNVTVPDVLSEILAAYPYPTKMRLSAQYARRDYVTQAGESDWSLIHRLCAQEGIAAYFEHSEQDHTLVLTDDISQSRPFQGFDSYPYHAPEDRVFVPHIWQLQRHEELRSGQYRAKDYDFARSRADLGVVRSDPLNDGQRLQTVYEYPGDYGQYDDTPVDMPGHDGERRARLRMEQLRSGAIRVEGAASIRSLAVGYTFKVQRHPNTQLKQTELLITQATTHIEDTGSESGSRQRWQFNSRFTAQALSLPWRPAWSGKKQQHAAPQTAIVVGEAEIWPDNFARVPVRFNWHRQSDSSQPADSQDRSICWLRIDNPMAGARFGGIFLPRRNQEVIVSYLDNDYDRPIITGRVYNDANMPPWELPGQHALSGIKSRELGGSQHSALIFDDSHDAIQAQFHCDYGSSGLYLGKIVRIPDHTGRQDARGNGFELRSDQKGSVRATGLFIVTDLRPQGEGHILAMNETATRLQNAQQLTRDLAKLAQHHDVQTGDDQQAVAEALKAHQQSITEDKAELKEADMVLSSAAGWHAASQQNLQLAAEENIAANAQQHISATARKNILLSAFEKLIVYVHRLGMQLFAEKGDIDVTANDGDINLKAQHDLNLVARRIRMIAEEEFTVNVGGTYYTLKPSGIYSGTSGEWLVRANTTNTSGPDSKPLPGLQGKSCDSHGGENDL